MDALKMYEVTFEINLDTKSDDVVFVSGSIPELGQWRQDCLVKLENTQDNIWRRKVIIKSRPEFFFKFGFFNIHDFSDQKFKYEAPVNRFVYLKLFENPNDIILKCKWETNIIKFYLHYEITGKEGKMFINGSHPSMGEWKKDPKVEMVYGKKIIFPYSGKKVKVWEFTLEYPLSQIEVPPILFRYGYYKYYIDNTTIVTEEVSTRKLSLFKIDDVNPLKEVDIVKKILCESFCRNYPIMPYTLIKDDYFNSPFDISKIGQLEVFIGPFPENEDNIKMLSNEGVKSVLNLQSDEDMNSNKVNWQHMLTLYKKYNIVALNFGVYDFQLKDLGSKLPKIAEIINDMIEKHGSIYVHCTAGIERSPTSVVFYLIHYKKMRIKEAISLVQKYRDVSRPNGSAINIALNILGSKNNEVPKNYFLDI